MGSSGVCWGIEIGAGAIKALKLEASGDDAVGVVDFAVIPHKKVLSTPDLDQAEATRLALGALMSQFDLSGASIAMSVPSNQGFARFAKLPPVDPKKVGEIVKYEAVQQIPFPIEDVEWDYQTFASPTSPDVEVGIFAITRERIAERLGLCQEFGLVPDVVTLSSIAAYNALAYDLAFTEQTPGTIILDVGNTSTDLIVAEAGRVWVRTFQIGGHNFTEALVDAFKLSYPKAEKLKREAEQSKHARHVFQAMRPVFSDLAQDVQRSIGYYQSLHPDANLVRLIGLGSTFKLPGLRKYLKQQLQLDVYRMEQFKRLSVDGPRGAEFQAATLNVATAYGLALQGLGLNTIDANLMPAVVLREAMWRRKVKWFGVAAGITAAAGAAMFLRPFLDANAVAAATPDSLIKRTVDEANRLRSRATEVAGQAQPDYRAAKMLTLTEGRGVVPNIVNDVSLLLEDADARLNGNRIFRLSSLHVHYRGPGQPQGNDALDSYGHRLRGSVESAPPPLSTTSPAGKGNPKALPRFVVEAEIRTGHGDPMIAILTTFKPWLGAHTVRDGVPYRIDVGSNLEFECVRSPSKRRATESGGQRTNRPINVDASGDDLIGDSNEQEPGAKAESLPRREAIAHLDRLAPLPPHDDEAVTGAVYRVRWEVELNDRAG